MIRFQYGRSSGKLLNIAMFFSGLCSDLRKLISQGLIIPSNPAILRGFLCPEFGLQGLGDRARGGPVTVLCHFRATLKRVI